MLNHVNEKKSKIQLLKKIIKFSVIGIFVINLIILSIQINKLDLSSHKQDYEDSVYDNNISYCNEIIVFQNEFFLEEDDCYVIFNSNGGTEIETILVENKRITLPEDPIKDGFEFKGWFYDNAEAFDINTDITETIELFAKWEKIGSTTDNVHRDYGNGVSSFSVIIWIVVIVGAIVILYIITRIVYQMIKKRRTKNEKTMF